MLHAQVKLRRAVALMLAVPAPEGHAAAGDSLFILLEDMRWSLYTFAGSKLALGRAAHG